MRRLLVSGVFVVVLLASVAVRAADLSPGTGSGVLPNVVSEAWDINERGQVVGVANTKAVAKESEPIDHAVLWQSGKVSDLGTLGGQGSAAAAINSRGQVVGWADTKAKDDDGYYLWHAVLWQSGRIRDLGTLGGPRSAAFAINAHGQVNRQGGHQRKGQGRLPDRARVSLAEREDARPRHASRRHGKQG